MAAVASYGAGWRMPIERGWGSAWSTVPLLALGGSLAASIRWLSSRATAVGVVDFVAGTTQTE